MRMTVNLDPDVYTFAQAYAGGKGISLSAAISELVRRAETVSEPDRGTKKLKTGPHGYLVVAGTGNAITAETVRRASEDEAA